MTNLTITLVQSHLFWDNPVKNRFQLENKLTDIPQTDLIIFPELFNTAFSLVNAGETMNGETINWMSNLANEKDAMIIGSLIINENNKKYNRLICMNPDGSHKFYDKRHLFGMMNESTYFTPGKNRLVVEFRSWKLCPLICYDLRFPVFSRNNENFDLLIYVANWPINRIDHWKKLILARAIENQCFVAGVNRVGVDVNGVEYNGHSLLVDFNGIIMHQGTDYEQVNTLTINKNDLKNGRIRLPFLKDLDSYTIN